MKNGSTDLTLFTATRIDLEHNRVVYKRRDKTTNLKLKYSATVDLASCLSIMEAIISEHGKKRTDIILAIKDWIKCVEGGKQFRACSNDSVRAEAQATSQIKLI